MAIDSNFVRPPISAWVRLFGGRCRRQRGTTHEFFSSRVGATNFKTGSNRPLPDYCNNELREVSLGSENLAMKGNWCLR